MFLYAIDKEDVSEVIFNTVLAKSCVTSVNERELGTQTSQLSFVYILYKMFLLA